MDIRIGLFGASGRMGAEILAAVEREQRRGTKIAVVCGVAAEGEACVGKKLLGLERPIGTEFDPSEVNVIVDFSAPEGTVKALEAAYQHKLPILVGTTGLPESYGPILEKVASVAPVIRTTNTSVGVNILLKLVNDATKMFGEAVDIEIVETHHKKKKDAPSGTAISLGESAAAARGVELKQVMKTDRTPMKEERGKGTIGIQAVRGGDVVGEHTVFFLGDGERVELTHRATKRAIFADGAVRAAKWLVGKKPGKYSMFDVLS